MTSVGLSPGLAGGFSRNGHLSGRAAEAPNFSWGRIHFWSANLVAANAPRPTRRGRRGRKKGSNPGNSRPRGSRSRERLARGPTLPRPDADALGDGFETGSWPPRPIPAVVLRRLAAGAWTDTHPSPAILLRRGAPAGKAVNGSCAGYFFRFSALRAAAALFASSQLSKPR